MRNQIIRLWMVSNVLSCAATPRPTAPITAPVTVAAIAPVAPHTRATPSVRSDPEYRLVRGAIREYQSAIALDPSRPDAWYDLGALWMDHCGDTPEGFDRGVAYVRLALRRAEGRPSFAALIARAEDRLRRAPPGMYCNGGMCRPTNMRAMASIPDATGALAQPAPPLPLPLRRPSACDEATAQMTTSGESDKPAE